MIDPENCDRFRTLIIIIIIIIIIITIITIIITIDYSLLTLLMYFQVTSLPSGAVVASEENLSPISRVAVLYKAGSRCEAPGNAGVSHILRLASSLVRNNMHFQSHQFQHAVFF